MNAFAVNKTLRTQCIVLTILMAGQMTLAQSTDLRPKLAVLRFKSTEETPERRNIVKDLSRLLAAGLRADSSVQVFDDAAVKAAIDDDGMKPERLLDGERCVEIGEGMGANYVVVGSAIFQRLRCQACVRVLDVKSGTLMGSFEAEYPADDMGTLYSVLAAKIRNAVTSPTPYAGPPENFVWQKEFLVSFGKHRIDLEPPILLAHNADPPFEISIVAEMSVAPGTHAVTNFEVFVDDRGLGSIHPELTPPRPVRERTWEIGGRKYTFSLDLNNMRVFSVQSDEGMAHFITSAQIAVSARVAKEGE